MKRLGHLENGKVLLECSQAEHQTFLILAKAAAGQGLPSYIKSSNLEGVDADLLATFNAIQEWILVKDKANQLRSVADQIDGAIGVKSDA